MKFFPATPLNFVAAFWILGSLLPTALSGAEPLSPAASAINTLGIDLLQQTSQPDANALLSPCSIQSALAMAYAGADGVTRDEMARVLHYPKDEAALHGSFGALGAALAEAARNSEEYARQIPGAGITNDPVALIVANRLFAQTGYEFRASYQALVRTNYGAPLELVDFVKSPDSAAKQINGWVEEQTRRRISDLIPEGVLDRLTRMVLVNAMYLKAPWAEPFEESKTRPGRFHVAGGKEVDVPMMAQTVELPYAKGRGWTAVALPYDAYQLQFLIFLPNEQNGLASVRKGLSPELIGGRLQWERREVALLLPKFELEPPVLALAGVLQRLGMKSAFDIPVGSANFERMAPRRPEDYLAISAVMHKTFLSLDEFGTEAAAATAVRFGTLGIHEPPKPVKVTVDHPFLFAIVHAPTGACFFLGQVADPR